MNINIAAIGEFRKGLTGSDLADHLLRSVDATIERGVYATAHPDDRASYRSGLLASELRKVCNWLAEAVEDPEPSPTLDDLAAIEFDRRQDWSVTERQEMANTLAARHGAHSARRFTGAAVTGFGEFGA